MPPSLLLSTGISEAMSVYWPGMPPRPSACRCPSRSMMGTGPSATGSGSSPSPMWCRCSAMASVPRGTSGCPFCPEPLLPDETHAHGVGGVLRTGPGPAPCHHTGKETVRLMKSLGRIKGVAAALSTGLRSICRIFLWRTASLSKVRGFRSTGP